MFVFCPISKIRIGLCVSQAKIFGSAVFHPLVEVMASFKNILYSNKEQKNTQEKSTDAIAIDLFCGAI